MPEEKTKTDTIAAEADTKKVELATLEDEAALEDAKVGAIRRAGKSEEEYVAELAATRVTRKHVWPPEPTDGEDDSAPPPPKTAA